MLTGDEDERLQNGGDLEVDDDAALVIADILAARVRGSHGPAAAGEEVAEACW